jgi:hypothetical protein
MVSTMRAVVQHLGVCWVSCDILDGTPAAAFDAAAANQQLDESWLAGSNESHVGCSQPYSHTSSSGEKLPRQLCGLSESCCARQRLCDAGRVLIGGEEFQGVHRACPGECILRFAVCAHACVCLQSYSGKTRTVVAHNNSR